MYTKNGKFENVGLVLFRKYIHLGFYSILLINRSSARLPVQWAIQTLYNSVGMYIGKLFPALRATSMEKLWHVEEDNYGAKVGTPILNAAYVMSYSQTRQPF